MYWIHRELVVFATLVFPFSVDRVYGLISSATHDREFSWMVAIKASKPNDQKIFVSGIILSKHHVLTTCQTALKGPIFKKFLILAGSSHLPSYVAQNQSLTKDVQMLTAEVYYHHPKCTEATGDVWNYNVGLLYTEKEFIFTLNLTNFVAPPNAYNEEKAKKQLNSMIDNKRQCSFVSWGHRSRVEHSNTSTEHLISTHLQMIPYEDCYKRLCAVQSQHCKYRQQDKNYMIAWGKFCTVIVEDSEQTRNSTCEGYHDGPFVCGTHNVIAMSDPVSCTPMESLIVFSSLAPGWDWVSGVTNGSIPGNNSDSVPGGNHPDVLSKGRRFIASNSPIILLAVLICNRYMTDFE